MKKGIITVGIILGLVSIAYAAAGDSSVISFAHPGRTLPEQTGTLQLADQAQLLGLYNGNYNPVAGGSKHRVNYLFLKRVLGR